MHYFQRSKQWMYGLKILDQTGCTYSSYTGDSFQYTLPGRGQKWSSYTTHPGRKPKKLFEYECGPNRLHIHNYCTAEFGPSSWWPWFARYQESDIVSKSYEKNGVWRVQLRRISPQAFHRMIRLGWFRGSGMARANLLSARLTGADLSNTHMEHSNLENAILRGANLASARLNHSNMRDATLAGAKMPFLDARSADLSSANMRGADLTGADMSNSNLEFSVLAEADLRGASFYNANLISANLEKAKMSKAKMRGAIYSKWTVFPPRFNPEKRGMIYAG